MELSNYRRLLRDLLNRPAAQPAPAGIRRTLAFEQLGGPMSRRNRIPIEIASRASRDLSMLLATRQTTVIDAPVATVFDYVADVRRQREWNRAVMSMEQVTPGAIAAGTRFAGRIKRVGPVIVDTVEYDRPHRIAHRAHPPIAEVYHEWKFHPDNEGTVLEQRAVMHPRRWGWVLLPLMPLIVRLNTRDCAVSLRRIFASS